MPPLTGGIPSRNVQSAYSKTASLQRGSQQETTGDITTMERSHFPPSPTHHTSPPEDSDSDDSEIKEGEEYSEELESHNFRPTRNNPATFRHRPGIMVDNLEFANPVISPSHDIPPPMSNDQVDDYLNGMQSDTPTTYTDAPYGLEEIAADAQATQENDDENLQASDYLPEPMSIKQVYKLPSKQRDKWINSVRKEATTIVENSTFILDDMPTPGEQVIPLKTVFKTKINADGSVNKLKARIVARGDLQKLKPGENTWSPTASMRLLKAFIASATQEGKEI